MIFIPAAPRITNFLRKLTKHILELLFMVPFWIPAYTHFLIIIWLEKGFKYINPIYTYKWKL